MKNVIKYILLFILLMNIYVLSSCTKKYTVSFYDYNGKLIEKVKVELFEEVPLPKEPTREGYVFVGWDMDLVNISKDTVVFAKYKEITKALKYELSSDNSYYIVTGIEDDYEENILIPSEYEGLPVKEIADEAFYNTYIKTVELQDNIVKIGNSSFAECSYLEEVNFGKNIKSIGDYAFSNCYYLTNISLPSGINEIGNNAFQHCRSIKEIKLPNSLTKLGTRAFAHCYYLQTIELSNQLVEVPDFCFQYCSNLSNIELPDSIITIGDSAFTYCENLKNIKLSKNIVIIERYAFNYCNNLESTLDLERVQSIGEHAFYACTKLRTILLSEAIKYIDGYAFHHCYALIIYCELPQALSNWDYYWNSYDVPVVWGYKK